MKNIPLFKTYLPKNTQKRLAEVMDSGWVGAGPETKKFEEEFGQKYDQKYCLATNSCTSALHLAYELAGVGPGDNVLCPIFTCTATNIPAIYQGAEIRWLDIDPQGTFNVNASDIQGKITERTKAIVVVHWGGYAAEMDVILKIANEYKLKVIVDAAHALGAKYKGKDISHYGDYICYSFQAIKQITTVEGGMLVVKNERDYKRANILRWYGIDREADRDKADRYENFSQAGWRYIPNDVFMAIGRIQLKENLEKVIKHRRKIASLYRKLLKDHPSIYIPEEAKDRFSTYWLFTVVVKDRPLFRKILERHGVSTGMAHFRNDISPVFRTGRVSLKNMDYFEDKYVCLPIHMGVKESDVKRICSILWDEYADLSHR